MAQSTPYPHYGEGLSVARKDDLMTLAQAAEYAGVPLRTIYYAAEKKYLKCRQYGRFRLTTERAVDRWLASEKKRRGRTS